MAEGVQLPDYLEELLAELGAPFLRPKEEAVAGAAVEDTSGAVEILKETVKPQDLDSNDPRRASVFEAFVASGFAWSVRRARRVTGRRGARKGDGFEPQILWKSDVNGGRPVSKRAEIRRKIAKADTSPAKSRSKGATAAVPGPAPGRGRANSRSPTMMRLESVIPDETAVKAMDLLEITGFDLLGLDTDLTPRPTTPTTPTTPATPRSRPTTRPTTPVAKLECPMLVRALVPNVAPEPGPEVLDGRNWTRESSMDPGEEGQFFRAISCAHRGKYNRALSSSFLRQISPMLRQISPERRQVSDRSSSHGAAREFRRLISPPMGATRSEPVAVTSGLELRGDELPSSISFQPGAEVQRLQTHEDEDEHEGSDPGTPYAAFEEEEKDSNLPETSKSSFSKSSLGLDKTFSFEDDRNMSKEFSEELDPLAPQLDAAAEALGTCATSMPAVEGPEGCAFSAAEAAGDFDPQISSVLDVDASRAASISRSSEEEPGVYLVPPWALRDHLQLDSRGASPPMRESMDRELQEVVKALEQAPALRGERVLSVRTPERPNSGGLVARMRHLVAASPELIPLRPGPKMALGTSLLSMSHPSRSTTKAQLHAQSQAMVKCKMPRQATHHLYHTPVSTEAWRIGQDADPAEESGADSPCHSPAMELSFIEETFFLTDP